MTKYTMECPDELWEDWKETVPRRINLNEGLLKLIAEETLEEREGQLGKETQSTIEEILEK